MWGILGALSGLGQGMVKVGERQQELNDKKEILAETNRMEMEKEKRINEAQAARDVRLHGMQKETMQWQTENEQKQLENKFKFENNPENVQTKANTEKALYEAKLKLEADPNNLALKKQVKQAENDLEIAKQVAIHRATDTTDYAGRALDRQIKEQTLKAALENSKTPQSVKTALEGYDKEIHEDQRTIATMSSDDPARPALAARINQSIELRHALANKYIPDDAKKAIERITEKTKKVDDEITNIAAGIKPSESPISSKTEPVKPKVIEPTEQPPAPVKSENKGIFAKKIKDYLNPEQQAKYDSLDAAGKKEIDTIMRIENFDSNQRLNAIKNVFNRY